MGREILILSALFADAGDGLAADAVALGKFLCGLFACAVEMPQGFVIKACTCQKLASASEAFVLLFVVSSSVLFDVF